MTEHDTSSPLACCCHQDNEEARCFDVTVEKLCNLAVLSVQEVGERNNTLVCLQCFSSVERYLAWSAPNTSHGLLRV